MSISLIFVMDVKGNEFSNIDSDANPNMKTLSNPIFTHNEYSSQNESFTVLMNEPGSVHLSFTCSDGVTVLLLWSGVHAYFLPEHYPVEGSIPPLPDGGNILSNYISTLLMIISSARELIMKI